MKTSAERLEAQRAVKKEWDEICQRLNAMELHERHAAVLEFAAQMKTAGKRGFTVPSIYRKLAIYRKQGCAQLPYSDLFRNKAEVLEYYEITPAMVRGWLQAKRLHSTSWCVANGFRKTALSELLSGRRGTGVGMEEMIERLAAQMRQDRPRWKAKLADLRERQYRIEQQIARLRRALGEE